MLERCDSDVVVCRAVERMRKISEMLELCDKWERSMRCWSYVSNEKDQWDVWAMYQMRKINEMLELCDKWERSVRCWSYVTNEKDQWDVGAMWQMRKINEMLELCDNDVAVCRAGGNQGHWNLRPSGRGEQAAHTQTWTLHLRSARSQQEPLQAERQFTSVQRLVFPVLNHDLFVHVDAK